MTPEQFKAAGLDKLSAEELANLNAWLNHTVDTETAKAAVKAKKKVEDDNRGFFNFGTSEPVASKIVGEFTASPRAASTRSTTARSGARPTPPRWPASARPIPRCRSSRAWSATRGT